MPGGAIALIPRFRAPWPRLDVAGPVEVGFVASFAGEEAATCTDGEDRTRDPFMSVCAGCRRLGVCHGWVGCVTKVSGCVDVVWYRCCGAGSNETGTVAIVSCCCCCCSELSKRLSASES